MRRLPVFRMPLLLRLALALGWAFLVLYPDPSALVRSVQNVRRPPVDARAVAAVAASLSDDPVLIERAVLHELVPYGYDWQVNGLPWYFPTAAEALAAGRGDCESRAVVLASILHAKGIPYQLRMSFDHIWVDYPGKVATALENDAVAIAEQGDGGFEFHWPQELDVWKELGDQVDMFWSPMPPTRRLALFGGVLWALCWNVLAAGMSGLRRPGLSLSVKAGRRGTRLPSSVTMSCRRLARTPASTSGPTARRVLGRVRG